MHNFLLKIYADAFLEAEIQTDGNPNLDEGRCVAPL